VRRLIINADDLGLTRGVNRGIAACHRRGVVTSSTLMANSAAFGDAVELTRDMPGLGIGCHVVLVDGAPVLPPADIPSLVTPAGSFRNSLAEFVLRALRGRISESEIEREATAQIRKLQQAGLTVTHVDTHKHTHMFPAVLRPLMRAAKACGVRAIRNPFAPVRPLAYATLLRRPRLWTRYSEIRVLRRYRAAFERAVQEAGLATTDGTFGILTTGALDPTLFEAILGCMPEGTWEFVCHPGYSDADLENVRTRLRGSRDREREVLTSPEARAALERAGIELMDYARLAEFESRAPAAQSNPRAETA
jgi:hopanoid biosynthesis associated protein HpnK